MLVSPRFVMLPSSIGNKRYEIQAKSNEGGLPRINVV